MRNTTLCYIEKEDRYLMLFRNKKKQDCNAGKWVGIGGGFEENESPEDCLVREVREETGYTLTSYKLRGIVTFVSDEWETEQMFLFTADGFCGEISECNEGTLEWHDKKDIFSLPMWKGDVIFLKLIEENSPFFLLKLTYRGDELVSALLDGQELI